MTQQDRDIETIKRVAGNLPGGAEMPASVQGDIRYVPMSDEEYNTHQDVLAAMERLKKLEEALPVEPVSHEQWKESLGTLQITPVEDYDAVEPPHYQRGPVVKGHIGSNITMGKGEYSHAVQCIEVMEAMQDPRLATAFKYIWRVAFGGKKEPWDSRSQQEIDVRDIKSAIWYLERFVQAIESDASDLVWRMIATQDDSEGH